MTTSKESYTGHCLCGALKYEIHGPLAEPHACHCGMCQRQSGNFTVATEANRSDFTITQGDTLKWYRSSDFAKRGFCSGCGSALFWDDGGDQISLNAGSLDQPTGLKLGGHIFVDDKPDYYEIEDGLPQHPQAAG